MGEPAVCPACQGVLSAGRCLACDRRRWSRFIRREVVLLVVLCGIAVAGFVATRALAASDERLRRQQAAFWFERGQERLLDGKADEALAALRRAALRDPRNPQYRLALGRTLLAAGHRDEARRMLLALRDEVPEDPETNLALARLEARGGDADLARRYYEAALAALWRPEQAEQLRALRLELIDLLLEHEARERALSHLLVLAPNVPEDAAAHAAIGRLFLQAGDPPRALDQFARALRIDPRDDDALTGAGEAAFAIGDYARARRHLGAVARPDARIAELAEVARLVLAADPLGPRLGTAERRRRGEAALTHAAGRVEACLAALGAADTARGRLASLQDEAAMLAPLLARRAPPRDTIESAVDLAYRMAAAVGDRCPAAAAAPLDRALVVIGRRHAFDQP